MKVSNLRNLKPARLQPIWVVTNGIKEKAYRCIGGPNDGTIINNPQDYFNTNTLEIDNEDS